MNRSSQTSTGNDVALLLVSQPRVTLAGASGCGKSSVALAGVVPRFRAAGGSVVVVRPAGGSSPLAALAASLLAELQPELDDAAQLERLPCFTEALTHGFGDVVAKLLAKHETNRLLVVVDQRGVDEWETDVCNVLGLQHYSS